MKEQTREVLTQYANGLISEAELHDLLDKQGVRGDADLDIYVGFDYQHQAWVKVDLRDLEYHHNDPRVMEPLDTGGW